MSCYAFSSCQRSAHIFSIIGYSVAELRVSSASRSARTPLLALRVKLLASRPLQIVQTCEFRDGGVVPKTRSLIALRARCPRCAARRARQRCAGQDLISFGNARVGVGLRLRLRAPNGGRRRPPLLRHRLRRFLDVSARRLCLCLRRRLRLRLRAARAALRSSLPLCARSESFLSLLLVTSTLYAQHFLYTRSRLCFS